MVEDVDQRKKLENALVQSEERYRNLFNYAPIALCEMDLSSLKKYMRSLEAKVGDLRMYFKNNPEAIKECMARIKILDMNKNMLTLFKADTKEEIIDQPGGHLST